MASFKIICSCRRESFRRDRVLLLHLRGKEEANEGEARLVDCRVRAVHWAQKGGRTPERTRTAANIHPRIEAMKQIGGRSAVAVGLRRECFCSQEWRHVRFEGRGRPAPARKHKRLRFAIILALPRPLHSLYVLQCWEVGGRNYRKAVNGF